MKLLEILVAAGIALLLALLCATVSKSALSSFTHTGTRFRDAATLTRLSSLWYAEQDDAWAIFTPPADVNGKTNADGHEVDFYTRDESGTDRFWSYTFDAAAHTLTRYVYTALGASPTVDQTFTAVTSFRAQTYPLASLQDSTSPIYSPMYANATLQNGAVRFFSQTAPWIAGGNQITDVRIADAEQSLEFHLSTQSAPSGYTVVLNYTPTPSASATPGLMVWPPAVRYGLNGSSIADAGRPRMTFVALLNMLAGGGVASASGTCPAQAFTDPSFTTPIAQGTVDPYGGSESITGANGCYDGGIDLNEAGSTAPFRDVIGYANSCTSSEVTVGSWTPSNATGAHVTQTFSGGSQTTAASGCLLGFSDGSHAPTVTAQVSSCDGTCYGGYWFSHVVQQRKCLGPTDCSYIDLETDTYSFYQSNDNGYTWTQMATTCVGSDTVPGYKSCSPAAPPTQYVKHTTYYNYAQGTPSSTTIWSPAAPPTQY